MAFSADIEIFGARDAVGAPLLRRRATHQGLVRFSRCVGLPNAVPDLLGMPLRLSDAHGAGRHQDFLLVTVRRAGPAPPPRPRARRLEPAVLLLPPLTLADALDHEPFSPWNTGGGLELDGMLNRLRDYGYPESQAGWSGATQP